MAADPSDSYPASIAAWRAERYAALRRETGWLTLAGLHWLDPGVNRIGTDPGADIVLPSGPTSAGTLTLADGRVVADGDIAGGAPVRLASDQEGEPTMLSLGSLRVCLIRRGDRLAVRTWDTEARQRRAFEGIDHYPVSPRWRLRGRLEAAPDRSIAVPDVLGDVSDEPSPGSIVFSVAGQELRLDALEGGGNGELWLVFGDATNGETTYGGGRFVYTSAPADDGTMWVDFNRAYNPPCAFTPYATCPLPPPQNRLLLAIEAGEKVYELR